MSHMSQALSAEVQAVVGAEPGAAGIAGCRLHLDLKPEPGSPSTRLVLVLDAEIAASLMAQMRAAFPDLKASDLETAAGDRKSSA